MNRIGSLGFTRALRMGNCPHRFMSRRPSGRSPDKQLVEAPSPSSLTGRDQVGLGLSQPSCQVLYRFLRDGAPDDIQGGLKSDSLTKQCTGRTLDEILNWNDQAMEAVHDYVQWIFPTDEASMFNSQAPLLSPSLQAICRKDEQIQENFEARSARAWAVGASEQHGY